MSHHDGFRASRTNLAYFDCFSGASGDMLLGSLLDAGLVLQDLQDDLAQLKVGGYELTAERVTRRGLTGTHFRVVPHKGRENDRPARTLPAIEEIIGDSSLPEPVMVRSLAVFRRIARVEAAIHGVGPDRIHFHEIGAVDSLVDIVGFACALQRLNIETVCSSPLTLGGGTVQTEHGRLPAPAPATLALLAEAEAPTVRGPAQTELVTPTGAALLAEYATFAPPAMTIRTVGYGFGTKEFDWPNAVRVSLGQDLSDGAAYDHDTVVLLQCNLDDTTGQVLGYLMDHLLAAGALDAWFTPIQMKKNRPAVLVSVLARPENAEQLADLVLQETPTLGVRRQTLSRTKAHRDIRQVETPWGPVSVKVKTLGGRVVAVSPEYEDCACLASESGVSLLEVMAVARGAAGASAG